jgi:predicted XRE-type DNA-binding protein
VKGASNKPGQITKGDIFDDLGFSPAETLEMKIKVEIWQALLQHIEQQGFTQAYPVTTLKAHQPDVSNLLHGKISCISITKADSVRRQAQSGCTSQGDCNESFRQDPPIPEGIHGKGR